MRNILFFSFIGAMIYFCVSCKDNIPTNPSKTDTTDKTSPKIYYFTPEKGVHKIEVKVYGKNFLKNYTELKLGDINCWDYKRETINDTDIIYIIIPKKAVTSKFTVFAGGKKATSEKAFLVIPADSVKINNNQTFYSACPGSTVRLTGKNLTYINNLEIFWYGVDVPGVTAKIISVNDNYIEIETPEKPGTYNIGFNYLQKQDLIKRSYSNEGAKILIGTLVYKSCSRNFALPGDKIAFYVNFLGNNPEIYFNGKKGIITDYSENGYYWLWNQSKGYPEYVLTDGFIVTTIPADAELPIVFKSSCGEVQVPDFKILKDKILPGEFNNITVDVQNLQFDYYSTLSYLPNDTSRGTTTLTKTFIKATNLSSYDNVTNSIICKISNLYSTNNSDLKEDATYTISLNDISNFDFKYKSSYVMISNNSYSESETVNFKLTGLMKILDDPAGQKKTVFEVTGSKINLNEFNYSYYHNKTYDKIATRKESTGIPSSQPDNARVTVTINYK